MTAPGIYRELPFEDYRAIDALNPSRVLRARISPLQFDYDRHNPREATGPMRFGSAVHCSVLEPDQFPLRYCIWTGGRRAGAEYKVFMDANEGHEILTEDEYAACCHARNAARQHPVAGRLLSAGDPCDREVSLVWNDRQTGLLCKGRADMLLPMIIDLKTTRIKVADDRAITRIASNMGYHISLAAYQDAVSTLTSEMPAVKVIFVEQLPPHDVRVLNVPNAVLAQGWDEWQRLLGQIAECEQSGVWPGCAALETDLAVYTDAEWEVE